jgi:hypothetical protein
MLGSVLSQAALFAVAGIFFVRTARCCRQAPWHPISWRSRFCAPVAAIGVSYPQMSKAFALGVIMLAGPLWSYGVFMCWLDERVNTEPTRLALMRASLAHRYGSRSVWRQRRPGGWGSDSH